MKTYGRRLLVFSIILHGITFLAVFLYSFFMFEEKYILEVFRNSFVFNQTFIRFSPLFIPVQMTAVVLTYGLGSKREDAAALGLGPFHRLIKSTMIFFLVLTALFTFLCEGILPGAHLRQQDKRHKTQVARNLLEESASLKAEGRYREAYKAIQEYLVFDPANQEQVKQLDDLMGQIIESRQNIVGEPEEPEKNIHRLTGALTAEEYMTAARDSYDKRDYLSAHYYATLAYKIDPRRQDADSLARQSWRRVYELTPSVYEVEQYRLHEQKKKGVNALLADRSLEAYYLFTQLQKDYPMDPDVSIYLEESRKAVRAISFFIDELEKTASVPGTRQIIFQNSRDDTKRELVYIDTFIPIREGYYLYGIEALSFTKEGTLLYHFTAPYGKIIGNRLVTLSIHRENPSDSFQAHYLAGERPDAERDILLLEIQPELIPNFSIEKGFLSRISLPGLWELGKVFSAFGVRKETVEIEVVSRITQPFAFLFFCFLALSLSWSLRPAEGKPGFLGYLLLILVPLVSYFLLSLYYYAARLFHGVLLLSTGFAPTLVIMIIAQGLLLILVFIHLAGQSTEFTE